MKKMMPFFIICFCLLTTIAHASSQIRPKPLTNLSTVSLNDRATIVKGVKQRIASNDKPYPLSMPVIEAAILGNDALYHEAKVKFLGALGLSEADFSNSARARKQLKKQAYASGSTLAFNTWILGRLLLSEEAIKPGSESEKALSTTLKHILIKTERRTLSDKDKPFIAWAWGYLESYYASAKKDRAYNKYVKRMHLATQSVIDINPPDSQSPRVGDVLWCFVLELNAAGAKHDRRQYNAIIKRVQAYTGKATLLASLQMISPDGNGYRAWALALSLNAAANVGDDKTFSAIHPVMDAAIKTPTETPDGQTLARLIVTLAQYNKKLGLILKPMMLEQSYHRNAT